MTDTSFPGVIVVGAGPAGVTAAQTLLERGAEVLLLDAGDGPVFPPGFAEDTPAPHETLSFAEFAGERRHRDPRVSPKFGTPTAQRIGQGFGERNQIASNGFHLFGAIAGGGLSTIWGGLAAPYDDDDLRAFPFAAGDLQDSYATVGRRMGINGRATDVYPDIPDGLDLQPPLDLHPTARAVYDRYRARGGGSAVRMGPPLQAVLTRDRDGRRACDYRGTCLNGCANGAIYSAAFALDGLRRRAGLTYRPDTLVRTLTSENGRWKLHTSDGIVEGRTVVLAAGTLATTRLVLASTAGDGKTVRLLHNPVVAAGYIAPSRLGAPATARSFGMAQLAMQVAMEPKGVPPAHAILYSTFGLSTSELAGHMPFSTPTSVRVLATIREALVPMTCFFPGTASSTQVRLSGTGETATLEISGGHDAGLERMIASARRTISRMLRRLGVYSLPGSLTLAPPGADLHYTGTLPMGAFTDDRCRVLGTEGLYIVDGSVFPELPARPCTFTIMAIADRAMRLIPLDA